MRCNPNLILILTGVTLINTAMMGVSIHQASYARSVFTRAADHIGSIGLQLNRKMDDLISARPDLLSPN